MTGPLEAELDAAFSRLRRMYDILPFFDRLLPVAELRLAPLPDEMLTLLTDSQDFKSIRPGEPVWITLAAPPDTAAEIVLYRAEADGRHYIVATKKI